MGNCCKTTISVPEMARILGIKKTDSYWLIHKNRFQTVTIAGQMRVVISSFEKWYANQTHYKKVDGPAPGSDLYRDSYSIMDIANMLEISDSSVYDFISRYQIETILVNEKTRMKKEVFDNWYQSQKHYRTAEDRERDRLLEESSLTLPEIGRILCSDRNLAYRLLRSSDQFEIIEVAGRKRVTKDSFEKWYSGQSRYHKSGNQCDADCHVDSSNMSLEKIGTINCDRPWYSLKEVSCLLKVSKSSILRLIQSKEIPAKQVNHSWRIMKDEFVWYLIEHSNNSGGVE